MKRKWLHLGMVFLLLLSAATALAQTEDDFDGDGVLDADDACFDVPGPASNDGCPEVDSDGDGIFDNNDLCPSTPGEADNNGCPYEDTDGDGVIDWDDICPDTPGPADNNGCPYEDADSDGVIDWEDLCPNTAGPPGNDGCPLSGDRDGDGVTDENDFCPTTAGNPANNGCPGEPESFLPDIDGDGMPDWSDFCETDPGPAWNSGCPEDVDTSGFGAVTPIDPVAPQGTPTFVPGINLPEDGPCVVATYSGNTPVNIRGETSLRASIVGLLNPTRPLNVTYAVIANNRTWYFVEQPEGYLYGEVVRLGGDCSELSTYGSPAELPENQVAETSDDATATPIPANAVRVFVDGVETAIALPDGTAPPVTLVLFPAAPESGEFGSLSVELVTRDGQRLPVLNPDGTQLLIDVPLTPAVPAYLPVSYPPSEDATFWRIEGINSDTQNTVFAFQVTSEMNGDLLQVTISNGGGQPIVTLALPPQYVTGAVIGGVTEFSDNSACIAAGHAVESTQAQYLSIARSSSATGIQLLPPESAFTVQQPAQIQITFETEHIWNDVVFTLRNLETGERYRSAAGVRGINNFVIRDVEPGTYTVEMNLNGAIGTGDQIRSYNATIRCAAETE